MHGQENIKIYTCYSKAKVVELSKKYPNTRIFTKFDAAVK